MRIRWRNLELPNKVTVDRDSFTEIYGSFSVEPFCVSSFNTALAAV